jgi:hypothetical protein
VRSMVEVKKCLTEYYLMCFHGCGLLLIVFYCASALLFKLMHSCAVKDVLGSIDDRSTLVDFSCQLGAI